MTAKDLKNRTGDAFRAVGRGESIVLTRHGKAVATIIPLVDKVTATDDYEESWAEIEAALKNSEPEFSSLDEAMNASRRRA